MKIDSSQVLYNANLSLPDVFVAVSFENDKFVFPTKKIIYNHCISKLLHHVPNAEFEDPFGIS